MAPRKNRPSSPSVDLVGATAPTSIGGRFRHDVLAVVFQVRANQLHVLLWQRAKDPDVGCWALPGGPLGTEELLGASLGRHLATKVDLVDVSLLEQLETRSDVHRDPRERTIATAYLALVATDVDPTLPVDTKWHVVNEAPPYAFDHESIVESGRDRLRAKLTYTNVGFALAPETFTIRELGRIYAACIGHRISATNLQNVLLRRQIIESTGTMAPSLSSGGRPALIYRFVQRTPVVTNPFAAFGSASSRTNP